MERSPIKKGKKIAIIIGIVLAVLLVGCAITITAIVSPSVPVTIVADYRGDNSSGVIQLPDVTTMYDDQVLAITNAFFNNSESSLENTGRNSTSAACSCLIVPISTESGTKILFGRNMDYTKSDKPAWVFYVDADDRYRTFNMGYLGDDVSLEIINLIPSMDEIAESKTIPKYLYMILPYLVTDVINEKGLLIETNVRLTCSELVCTGTNPESNVTICSGLLPRYLGDHCSNIEEALKMVESLNIYTPNNDLVDVHFAFALMDASGRYGVLEFANNKVIWHEGQPGHSNFWIDKNAYNTSNSCFGLGRWESLLESAPSITSERDMQEALKKVYMGQVYVKTAPDNVTYDIITDINENDIEYYYNPALKLNHTNGINLDNNELEKVKDIIERHPEFNNKEWGADNLTNPENREDILTFYNFIVHFVEQMPQKYVSERKILGNTVFSYVTTNEKPVLNVKFFEHDEIFQFGFTKKELRNTDNPRNLTKAL